MDFCSGPRVLGLFVRLVLHFTCCQFSFCIVEITIKEINIKQSFEYF